MKLLFISHAARVYLQANIVYESVQGLSSHISSAHVLFMVEGKNSHVVFK